MVAGVGTWTKQPCPHSMGHFSHLSHLIVVEPDVNFETTGMGKREALFYLFSFLRVSGVLPGCPIGNAGLSGQNFGEEGPHQAELTSHFQFAQLCFMDPAPSSRPRTLTGSQSTLLSTT